MNAFTFEEATSLYELIRKVSLSSLPFWLAFILPTFYLLLKAALTNAPAGEGATRLDRFFALFAAPRGERWLLYLSTTLFVTGIIAIKVHADLEENLKKDGLRIKHYYVHENAYTYSFEQVEKDLHLDECRLERIADRYPNEFIVYEHYDSQTRKASKTLLMTDSVAAFIYDKSTRLLNTYLEDSLNLSKGRWIYFDTLRARTQKQFTRELIRKLIVDSSHKYHYVFHNAQEAIKKR